jgi:hypothetical protein
VVATVSLPPGSGVICDTTPHSVFTSVGLPRTFHGISSLEKRVCPRDHLAFLEVLHYVCFNDATMGKRLLMKTFVIMTPRSGVIMTGLLPQALLGGQILGLSVYLHWLQHTMRSTVVIKRRAFAFVRGVGTPGTRKQEASHMRVELHCMLADHLLCMFYWVCDRPSSW